MAETHVPSALTKKRAEVSGEIKHYESLLKKSKLSLQSLDQTIHLFDESVILKKLSFVRLLHNIGYLQRKNISKLPL